MDDALRHSLWNVVHAFLYGPLDSGYGMALVENLNVLQSLWYRFFKQPVDTLDERPEWRREELNQRIRAPFLTVWPWWQVYDFVEFLPLTFTHPAHYTAASANDLRALANTMLERELSAYRFVGPTMTPITDEMEIQEIEHAVNAAEREPWGRHLRASLAVLSSRENPDYANAIKEAISGVEATCQRLTANPKATLGDALGRLDLHPAMRDAFSKLYGWTSDDGGIRHAIADGDDPPGFAEAKFMLVACSAFVNFLLQKQ